MNYSYNPRYYDGKDMWQLRPHRKAIHTYVFPDGVVMGMFQGNRGSHPEIDFIIRILRVGENERPEPPMHTYWVVDLILKSEKHPNEVKAILDYYIDFYDKATPFNSVKERQDYSLKTVAFIASNILKSGKTTRSHWNISLPVLNYSVCVKNGIKGHICLKICSSLYETIFMEKQIICT